MYTRYQSTKLYTGLARFATTQLAIFRFDDLCCHITDWTVITCCSIAKYRLYISMEKIRNGRRPASRPMRAVHRMVIGTVRQQERPHAAVTVVLIRDAICTTTIVSDFGSHSGSQSWC